jgi:general secretion pathway protein L
MALSVSPSRLLDWPTRAAEHVRAFGRWWLKEFLGLFPERIADWLVEGGSRTLVIGLDDVAVTLRLISDRRRLLAAARVGRAEYSAESIDAFLKPHGVRRRDVSLALGLPPGSMFSRSFALPLETRRSLATIVVQDLVAKTPFQLDGIHQAHVARRDADKFQVWQWVVRRGDVAEAGGALGLEPDEVAFVESPGARSDDGPVPVITLRQAGPGRRSWPKWAALMLSVTALALALAAVGAKVHRQQVLLDSLDAEIGGARTKAKAVQAAIRELEQAQARLLRLRSIRSEPGLLDIWEETTRILPAHTWLSELRLNDTAESRQVVMTGFAAAAASLVGLVDRSALFGEASLAGPVTLDQAEGKERFVIQATVNRTATPRTAGR